MVLNHDGAVLDVVSCAVYAALADLKLPNVLVQTGDNSKKKNAQPRCRVPSMLADMKLPYVLVHTGCSSHIVALYTTNIADVCLI